MPRKRRRKFWLRVLIVAASAALAGYLFVYPIAFNLLVAWFPERTAHLAGDSLAVRVQWSAIATFIGLWFFTLGACFGSFINVVAWRLPRGMSLLGTSRCPHCRKPLSLRENLPIVGWLRLRGRCARCHLPISPRYVLVELILGTAFLVLMLVELASGGANLPNIRAAPSGGFLVILTTPQWRLVGVYAYHAGLLCLLLTFALTKSEGMPLPLGLIAFAVVAGLAAAIVWPHLQPVPWMTSLPGWLSSATWLSRYMTPLLGLAVGILAGAGIDRLWSFRAPLSASGARGPEVMAGLGVAGLFLGWQAALSMAVIAAGLLLVVSLASRPWPRLGDAPALAFVFVAALVQICLWRQLNEFAWWPGGGTDAVAVLLACALTVALVFAARRFSAAR